ncbi:MAG: heme-binding protein [Coriobacteriia bacterium]|nr:heme-binding protein [Coriobacteriia bacterium]
MSVESPRYEVLQSADGIELRRYAPYLTANARVHADGYGQAANVAFNALADYIFGNNTSSVSIPMTAPVTAAAARGEKIEMTVPVTAERARDEQLEAAEPLCTVRCADEYVVSFTMPSRFSSLDELPRPGDARVTLEAVPEHLAVALRFSGYLNDDAVAQSIARISEWIADQGLVAAGEPVAAQFDSPWKPWFARHNEVLVAVTEG